MNRRPHGIGLDNVWEGERRRGTRGFGARLDAVESVRQRTVSLLAAR